jgi:hypothetical protein
MSEFDVDKDGSGTIDRSEWEALEEKIDADD